MSVLKIDAQVEKLDEVLAFIDEELEKHEASMKVQTQIDFKEEPTTVIISFADQGMKFNPLERKDPDTTLSVEERQIGGLGIFIVKKSMDSVNYEYKDGSNIFTIEKIIS